MSMTKALGAPADFRVEVLTTNNRGFTPEELSDLCVNKIISISESAPPAIAEQAKAFKDSMRGIIALYMRQAIASDRTTMYNKLEKSGHGQLAEIIRGL